MIHWLWLLPALTAGGFIGALTLCLFVGHMDEYDNEGES